MQYILVERETEDVDEPFQVYSELDSDRHEVRKMEFFRGGLCFSYGKERGHESALAKEPFPQDLQALCPEEGMTAQEITRTHFESVWNQVSELPDGFMGMFW